jgi:uncharacterized protein
MYFDPRPKTRKEDLFSRNAELEKFDHSLTYAPLIVVTGLRRTGKTSFVDVALSCTNHPHVFVDMRDLPVVPSRTEMIQKIETAFSKMDNKWLTPILEAVKHVKGVALAGTSLTFEWGKKGIDLAVLLDEIDSWAKKHKEIFLLAFDEIQLIRGDRYLPRLLARIADTNRNIVTIITGSEVGLLYDFLGFDDPESPLYGRHYVEIKMSNFTPEQSKSFLMTGFKQVDIECSDEIVNYAVQKLDGIVGWLTLLGVKSRESNTCSKFMVDEVLDTGGKLARSEALRIVRFSRRYGVILNFLANAGENKWSKIKSAVELDENRKLTNASITDLLNRLVKTSLIVKENGSYRIADPLLTHGVIKEPL